MEILEEIKDNPSLFSKKAIVFLSALYSPLFGSLVYVSNLQEVNKREFIFSTILSMLLLNVIIIHKLHPLFSFIPFPIKYFLLNALGGLLIAGPFWDHHLKEVSSYEKRRMWSPFLAGFLVYGGFIILGFYLKYKIKVL